MRAERLIATTDAEGHLTGLPKLPPNKRVEAIFLVLDDAPGEAVPNGTILARLARDAAQTGVAEKFGDPVEWQRETRRDRPLPGRDPG